MIQREKHLGFVAEEYYESIRFRIFTPKKQGGPLIINELRDTKIQNPLSIVSHNVFIINE